MNLPLYPNDVFGFPTGQLVAVVIGIAFGFVLERAGFGRAPMLAAQFYGTNNRVLKVMFTAIVTALVGLALLSGVGLVELSQITVPGTFIWPQLVGGLLFGVGFIVSGYCPGTSVAAAASGNWDGLVTYGGVALGTLVFGLTYPLTEGFYLSGAMGSIRLDQLLGVPFAVLAVGVLLMAAGAFLGVERLEAFLAARRGEEAPDVQPRKRNRVLGGLAVAAAGAVIMLAIPGETPAAAPEAKQAGSIGALELAGELVRAPQDYWVADLRDTAACEGKRVPGALCTPADDPEAGYLASLPATRILVVYGASTLEALPPAAQRFPGRVHILDGGYPAFEEAVLQAPAVPEDPTPAQVAEYELRTALHGHFNGSAAAPRPVRVVPKAVKAVSMKKGGGC